MNTDTMDNVVLNVNGSTRKNFEHVMHIAFSHAPGGVATHWAVDPMFGLILLWHGGNEGDRRIHDQAVTAFPHGLDVAAAINFVWDWLEKADRTKFKLEGWDGDKDHDGHNSHGWRVYVQDWGHVAHSSYAICAILPTFMWHGK